MKSSKITKATFKSFLRKNPSFLINVKSAFDGMTDGCERRNDGFVIATKSDMPCENNCGINGIWLVGGSRDYFSKFEEYGKVGISVYNCCGSFVVAVESQS